MIKLNQLTTAEAMSHPDVAATVNALGKMCDELRTQNQVLVEALKAVIADRDDMCFDKEKHVESEYGAYWSPSASMVHSHVIAQARAALAQAEGDGTFGLSMSMFANKQDYEDEKNRRMRALLDVLPVAEGGV